jgi:hypothetical protein
MTTARHRANAGRHSLKVRGADLYETPACAVHALMRVEQLPQRIWEPACGPGAIVRVLRAAGHQVHATGLHDWGCPDSHAGVDFLQERTAPPGTECILTNPPGSLCARNAPFVTHALELAPLTILLLRLAFFDAESRAPLLNSGILARVHVFHKRLPRMHRYGWTGRRATSSMCFAWFVFDCEHVGPTSIDTIAWQPEPSPADLLRQLHARAQVPQEVTP